MHSQIAQSNNIVYNNLEEDSADEFNVDEFSNHADAVECEGMNLLMRKKIMGICWQILFT